MSGTLAERVALPGRGALLQPLGVCVARVAWAWRVGLGAKVRTHPWWWLWWAPCWQYLGRRMERGFGHGGPPAWGACCLLAQHPQDLTLHGHPVKHPEMGRVRYSHPTLQVGGPCLTASGSGSQNGEAGYCPQSLWEHDDPTRPDRDGLGEEPAGVLGRGHRGWPWERAGQDPCSCPSPTVHWGAPGRPPTTWAPVPPRKPSLCLQGCWEVPGGVQSRVCGGER